ncbi:MAG: 5'-nucleotidase, lipoprotein e(P4) family [Candidatus Cloacimonetes bacterium]|nr:5'-nucleotidase, lipoprotein e(P4) family [Candidatus Cloacimonadota bacterium]
MKKIFILVILLLFFSMIRAEEPEVKDEAALLGVLYHQTAAEYTALCYQAYNLATDRLLATDLTQLEKPAAIILDVDETVLNNSPYNARALLGKTNYTGSFNKWVEEMQCEPIAGALAFLYIADSLGIKIFYVTNRSEKKKQETIANLQKIKYPQVTEEQVLCKVQESSKEPRRQFIAENYEILLLLGDNLIDFAECFEGSTMAERESAVQDWQQDFGRRFIILPNMMHGNWLKVLNDFRYDLSREEALAKRLKYLKY